MRGPRSRSNSGIISIIIVLTAAQMACGAIEYTSPEEAAVHVSTYSHVSTLGPDYYYHNCTIDLWGGPDMGGPTFEWTTSGSRAALPLKVRYSKPSGYWYSSGFAVAADPGGIAHRFIAGVNGETVSSLNSYQETGQNTPFYTSTSLVIAGNENAPWPPSPRFVFLGFTIEDTYGWIRLALSPGDCSVVDFAQETTPGMPIGAGEIAEGIFVPEPASLTLLAFGLLLVRLRR